MKPFRQASQERKYAEILSRLDRIITLLTDLGKISSVGGTVSATANEYFTNDDLCRILRVSKRTLSRYRQQKLINYYTIRGKVYYKVSEVSKFLKKRGSSGA